MRGKEIMKKSVVTGVVCALMVAAAGCGSSDVQGNDTGVETQPIGEVGVNTAETSGNTDQQTDNSQSEAKPDDKVEGQADNNSAATGDLYEAFKQGKASVKYRGTGDRTSYLDTTAALIVDESFTIDEIVNAIEARSEEMHGSDVEYSMIDCGSDGVQELLAQAHFGDEFTLNMIIKEIGGELVMCWDQDSWSRSYVDVKNNGVIEGGGSGGAAVHGTEYAYVDAAGDYKFYYGCEETLTLYGDFYAFKGNDLATIPTEGLDADHLGVWDYYFEADPMSRDHYYSYFVIDDNFNDVTTDADYDDSNELKKRFTDAGIKTYTKSEIDQMLKDRATQIGYTF